MASTLLIAVAAFFVIEGLLPFLAPAVWRETLQRISRLTDGQIRFVGLASMLVGLLLLVWARA
jgi:uncharacterized protein YjeT (DUF2065 family)